VAKITLYGTFRRHVDDWQREIDAPTVGGALRTLTAGNPPLRGAIFDDGGGLREYVRVIVNGRDVALAGCLETPLAPGDAVAVFSPIAGGRAG
jgi:molybdopterin converting factor small subunit